MATMATISLEVFCQTMATAAEECIEQEPEDLQWTINAELLGMIACAKNLGILPQQSFTEIEFNLTEKCQAISIEYWPNSLRLNEDRAEVMIPPRFHHKFVFHVAARALNRIVK